jgi:hypothetical protein
VRVLTLACAVAWAAGCRSEPGAVPVREPDAGALPVYFTALEAFVPERLPGWERESRPEGSTGKYGGVTVSEVEAVYTRGGEQRLSVRIVDTSLLDKLAPAIRSAVEGAEDRAAEDPAAPLRLPHAFGFVRYDADERHGEANLLVGDRYVVALAAEGFPDTKELRQVAGQHLDLAGLSRLR